MAQEDKGLVLRGLLLLTGIGVIVAIVLAIVLWRPQAPDAVTLQRPEYAIVRAALPGSGAFPANVNWEALSELGETAPSAPGWEVRYNAAVTLARRGSSAVPWPLISEMLDERQQMRNYRVRKPDGRDVYDEGAARANIIGALRAVAVWHEKRKPAGEISAELRDIQDVVSKLANHSPTEVQIQAQKTRATFQRK